MNITNLGNFLAPTFQFVKEGYNKTSEFACSFFKNLASNLTPSTKTRVYASVVLFSLISVGIPLASAAPDVWTSEDMKLTNICCSPGFFLKVMDIVYRFLNNNNQQTSIQYITNGLNYPFYVASNGTCTLNIPEYVEMDGGILSFQPKTDQPGNMTVYFKPELPKLELITDCPLNKQALIFECLKNGLMLRINQIQPISK